ncbi:MAG: histidine kinase [Actinomycetota bacterium]
MTAVAAESPVDVLAAWRSVQQQRLVTFVRVDAVLTFVSGYYVLAIYWFAAREGYLLAAYGVTMVGAAILSTALRSARRSDAEAAVARLAAANWFMVIGGTLLAAPVWPVLVLASLLPMTAAASYVEQRQFRWYLLGSVAVAAACTLIGLFTAPTSIADDVPAWTIDSVLTIFVPVLTAMVGLLALQNFSRTRLTIANLVEAHQRLQSQSDALLASRIRMVAATDGERRRIERDLHDGTQQHFVSLLLKTGAINRVVRDQPDRAESLLGELRQELKAAQTELREFTLGIYPPSLTQHGLAAALRRAVDRVQLPSRTDIDDVDRFDPSIEATVYFICLEALQNADKHAGSDATVRLSLAHDDGMLRFEVADDGVGFAPGDVAHRSGTQNMEDRIAIVQGRLTITSSPGSGTIVLGEIPV